MTAQALASKPLSERERLRMGVLAKAARGLSTGTSVHFTSAEVIELQECGALLPYGIEPTGYVAPHHRKPIQGAWPTGDVVYFIGPYDGPVKIGFTNNLNGRYRDLKYMSPAPIHVWAYVHGSIQLEKRYHQRFASSRLHGEWFERTAELIAEIDALNGRAAQ